MAAISTIIGAIGVAAGAAGTVAQMSGAKKSQRAQERAEQVRKTQMDVESTRQRRQVVRQMMAARAEALSSATAQGAAEGSGLAGGIASVQSQAGTNIAGINTGQQLGTDMFAANAARSRAESQMSFGSGLSSLGGALVQNAGTLGRLVTFGSRGAIQN